MNQSAQSEESCSNSNSALLNRRGLLIDTQKGTRSRRNECEVRWEVQSRRERQKVKKEEQGEEKARYPSTGYMSVLWTVAPPRSERACSRFNKHGNTDNITGYGGVH